METQKKTPNNTTQKSGGHYFTFTGLNNIKNTSGTPYAITTIIGPKLSNKNRPATVSATNYKFNIPSDAIVKKITVHYRHSKRGEHNQQPTTDPKWPVGNIPSPTISVLNTNLSGKGQAPARTGSHQTLTFTGEWSPSVVNSPNFGVKINYPANTSVTNKKKQPRIQPIPPIRIRLHKCRIRQTIIPNSRKHNQHRQTIQQGNARSENHMHRHECNT